MAPPPPAVPAGAPPPMAPPPPAVPAAAPPPTDPPAPHLFEHPPSASVGPAMLIQAEPSLVASIGPQIYSVHTTAGLVQQPYLGTWTGLSHFMDGSTNKVLHQQPYFGGRLSMPYNTAPSTGVVMTPSTWQHGIHELNYGGSFRELMLSAQAGSMHFDIEGQSGTENIWRPSEEVIGDEADREMGGEECADDGYLGGEECADEDYDDDNIGDDGAAEQCADKEDADSRDVADEHCADEECSAERIFSDDQNISDKKIGDDTCSDSEGGANDVHLGDCGCVTGDGNDWDSDDIEDISADLTDSDEEEEITIELDLSQEFYVNKEQEGVPYKKRKRVQKSVKRPNCRKPRMIGAVERALRSASTRKEGSYIFEPKIGMVFDSRVEAREFYNMYSWEVGFGIKYNSSRPLSSSKSKVQANEDEDDEPYKSMQEIVCQKSGNDSRITTGTKRCGCPAKIRLLRTDDYGWYISVHVADHNHELWRTTGQKREWNSHRQIEPCMKDMIKQLRLNNVPLTRVHCIMGDMYGSKEDLPWTKRSLRTICNQIRKDQMVDDMRKTMEIFRGMHESDPGFQFSVDLDKHGRVRTLLWCSGRGREHYACFGDVVTFDTTYCTNIYKMPFGLFVGVNNHFQTTIFAGVLMRRETAKSFKWVFNEFLHLMGGEAPKTILTDQCKAMAKALRLVMPSTYHLWCKWHVMKKIRECLGPLYTKNKKFRDQFWLIVNGMLTEDEFEAGWADLVKRYHLEQNAFMKRIYNCKKRWAKPWAKDKFCARMSSTQRSESANFMLKQFVPRNSSMNHFVSQYSRLLYDREREEDIAEHKTRQLKMVHSRLWSIERHALSIYTKAAFELFRSEVDKASNYKLKKDDGQVDTYIISHDRAERRAHWARVHFRVQIVEVDGGKRFICECGLYEHFGMLCCHSLRVMLHEQTDEIPSAHIMKRWTRDARDVLPTELKRYQKDHASMHSKTFRNRLLNMQSVELQATGDSDLELFEVVMKHMKAAKKEAADIIAKRKENADTIQDEDSSDEDLAQKGTVGGEVHSDGGCLRTSRCAGRPEVVMPSKDKGSAEPDVVVLRNNRYGASGSSAHYSDSEIVRMKAPFYKKPDGRPRNNRFYAGSEQKKKKWQKKKSKKDNLRGVTNADPGGDLVHEPEDEEDGGEAFKKKKKATKREIRCGKCFLTGHNVKQCCSIQVNETTARSYF